MMMMIMTMMMTIMMMMMMLMESPLVMPTMIMNEEAATNPHTCRAIIWEKYHAHKLVRNSTSIFYNGHKLYKSSAHCLKDECILCSNLLKFIRGDTHYTIYQHVTKSKFTHMLQRVTWTHPTALKRVL